MKVIVAGDQYAIDLVAKVESYLKSRDMTYENVGSKTSDHKTTLQKMIPVVTKQISEDVSGILICGTGVGVEIGANRFRGVRASLCLTPETAKNARQYDNANVLCLSSWQTTEPIEILDAWFGTQYDGDVQRLEMLKEFDGWAK